MLDWVDVKFVVVEMFFFIGDVWGVMVKLVVVEIEVGMNDELFI